MISVEGKFHNIGGEPGRRGRRKFCVMLSARPCQPFRHKSRGYGNSVKEQLFSVHLTVVEYLTIVGLTAVL
jgi:hypothetical protein